MSRHYEDHAAMFTSVSFRTPGTWVGELYLEPGQYAITLGDESTAVVYGTVVELVKFATRIDVMIPHILAHQVGGEPGLIPHQPYAGEPFDPDHDHDWADGICNAVDCAAVLPEEDS